MITIKQLKEHLDRVADDTVVVLDQDEAESLDVACDYIQMDVILGEIRDGH